VARFHAQEARTPYMAQANWDNIDHVSFVSEHTRRQALEVFDGFPFDKTSVIPNYLDDIKFTPKKKTGEARFTLGMVGVAPKSKRLDRAVDLLEALLEEDDRYCLRVKGKHPLDYGWLLKREDELAYYRKALKRINSNPSLRYNVIFDSPADDVNDWLSMVGFILSPSDFESFHMSVGEGILAGSRPLVWPWDGAEAIWTRQNVYKGTEDIAQAVLTTGCTHPLELPDHLRPDGVVDSWVRLLRGNDDG
jgi:glycosyltransferase involved in cell wall biosynthesis